MLYLIEQCLNGIQLGMLLFLLAAGLTLIFGIMDLVNLAHGSLYMLGAYFAATFAALTDSFLAGIGLALLATLVAGMALEVLAIQWLGGAEIHRDAVLHDLVALENLLELSKRTTIIRHVVLGDDLEPVDHRLVFEDVLEVWIAQSDADTEVMIAVEAICGHVQSLMGMRRKKEGRLAPRPALASHRYR